MKYRMTIEVSAIWRISDVLQAAADWTRCANPMGEGDRYGANIMDRDGAVISSWKLEPEE